MNIPEKRKEYQKLYGEKNKERLQEYRKVYYAGRGRAQRAAYVQSTDYLLSTLLRNAKDRARKKGLAFDITIADIVIPERCPILGMSLVRNSKVVQADSITLDRTDSCKGYIKGNVQVVSFLANTMKSSATPEQLLLFADWVNNNVKL